MDALGDEVLAEERGGDAGHGLARLAQLAGNRVPDGLGRLLRGPGRRRRRARGLRPLLALVRCGGTRGVLQRNVPQPGESGAGLVHMRGLCGRGLCGRRLRRLRPVAAEGLCERQQRVAGRQQRHGRAAVVEVVVVLEEREREREPRVERRVE